VRAPGRDEPFALAPLDAALEEARADARFLDVFRHFIDAARARMALRPSSQDAATGD
jgi:hypothetical protein